MKNLLSWRVVRPGFDRLCCGGGWGPGGLLEDAALMLLLLDDRRNMIASASAPLNSCSGMFNTPMHD